MCSKASGVFFMVCVAVAVSTQDESDSCDNMNYYEILGIEVDITDADALAMIKKKAIKRAYYKQALKWHPDKNDSPEANARFMRISEAFSVLSDKKLKSKYDRRLRRHKREEFDSNTMDFEFDIGDIGDI